MCEYPYIESNIKHNNTQCITYGEYIGSSFVIYYSIFLSLSLLCFLLTIIQTTKLFLKKDIKIKDNFQFILLILSTIMSLFVLIQNIDPYNYYSIYPKIVESLFSNLTTDIGLIILFLFISKYLKVLSFMNKEHKIIYFVSCLVVIFFTFVFSFLETYINYGLFRGIRLIMLSMLSLITTIGLNILMLKVLNMLTLLNTDDSVEELKLMRNKLLRYTISFDIFILTIICFQLYTAINSFSNNSVLIPNITPDMIFFPLAQIIGILFVVFFTFETVNKSYAFKIKSYLIKIKQTNIKSCFEKSNIADIENNIENKNNKDNKDNKENKNIIKYDKQIYNDIDFENIGLEDVDLSINTN